MLETQLVRERNRVADAVVLIDSEPACLANKQARRANSRARGQ